MGQCCSTCWSNCLDLPPDINPKKVDMTHFTQHRVLGKGGFGKVQVVESRLNHDYYAIKSMNKAWLITNPSNVKSVWLERHIQVQLRSQFLVPAYYSFQDAHSIYLVLHFMSGGDLHFLIHPPHNREGSKPLSEEHARFYMAEILLGLEEMHSVGLIYRDLKPENVLLDGEGHIRLSDFGLAGDLNTEPDGMTVGACGTSGYMSRELLANAYYDFTPDVYAYGVVMYELLHGYLPVQFEDPSELHFSSRLSQDCIDLLKRLLNHDPSQRIGCDIHKPNRWVDVKNHVWFTSVDWELAARKGLTPPHIPTPDIANCDPMFELEDQLTPSVPDPTEIITDKQNAIFHGWDWHTEVEWHTKDSNLRGSSGDGLSGSSPTEFGSSDSSTGSSRRASNGASLPGPRKATMLDSAVQLMPTRHTRSSSSDEFDAEPLQLDNVANTPAIAAALADDSSSSAPPANPTALTLSTITVDLPERGFAATARLYPVTPDLPDYSHCEPLRRVQSDKLYRLRLAVEAARSASPTSGTSGNTNNTLSPNPNATPLALKSELKLPQPKHQHSASVLVGQHTARIRSRQKSPRAGKREIGTEEEHLGLQAVEIELNDSAEMDDAEELTSR